MCPLARRRRWPPVSWLRTSHRSATTSRSAGTGTSLTECTRTSGRVDCPPWRPPVTFTFRWCRRSAPSVSRSSGTARPGPRRTGGSGWRPVSRAAPAPSWPVFFFQAEDGIRYHCVTGVQTCALPISLSPDGKWIAFDLLGHIYRMPATGGKAECLTQDTGIALNMQPRYSPDGKTIAFISDRKGQNNLWLMDADGKNPRAVFMEKTQRALSPVWTPDGNYIVVQRQGTRRESGPEFNWSLVMYHKSGGAGVELVGKDKAPGWHSISNDGKYLYFDVQACPPLPFGHTDPMLGCSQLRRINLQTRKIEEITGGQAEQQDRGTSGGGVAPEVSPDGRFVASARRIPEGLESYKGHTFGPRTALWLRDMQTGDERLLMDPIELDESEEISRQMPILPGMVWSADGKSIVISQGGTIRRVSLDSGKVERIAFTAHVHRTISEMAYSPLPLRDDAFEARFIRWQSASSNHKQLVFQAIGKLWLMDLPNGKPRRLTPDSFAPGEFSPAWSPDNKTIA